MAVKAAVLREVPGDLRIEELEIDRPWDDEVLVRTVAAGICHTDLHFMRGDWRCQIPAVLGHEVAGIVEETGTDVRYVRPGDHIVGCSVAHCGTCDYCVIGRPVLCANNDANRPISDAPRLSAGGERIHQFGNLSGFAQKLLIHERAVVKVPPDLPLDRAALFGCSVVTGLGAVFNAARVAPGGTVAVIGCGGVGLNCIQGARIAGATRIIAIDHIPIKLELARSFGATDTLNAIAADFAEEVRELTLGGVDYTFEATGVKALVEQAVAMLAPGGVATLLGHPPQGSKAEFDIDNFIPSEKTIKGCLAGSLRPRVDIPRYIDLYLDGRLEIDALISNRRPLDEVNEAFASLERGEVARSVIVFD